MVQTYEIKEVTVADIEDLQRTSCETLSEASNSQSSPENMEKFLDKVYVEEKLKAEIES